MVSLGIFLEKPRMITGGAQMMDSTYGRPKIAHSSLRARVKQFYHMEAALVTPFLQALLSLLIHPSWMTPVECT